MNRVKKFKTFGLDFDWKVSMEDAIELFNFDSIAIHFQDLYDNGWEVVQGHQIGDQPHTMGDAPSYTWIKEKDPSSGSQSLKTIGILYKFTIKKNNPEIKTELYTSKGIDKFEPIDIESKYEDYGNLIEIRDRLKDLGYDVVVSETLFMRHKKYFTFFIKKIITK